MVSWYGPELTPKETPPRTLQDNSGRSYGHAMVAPTFDAFMAAIVFIGAVIGGIFLLFSGPVHTWTADDSSDATAALIVVSSIVVVVSALLQAPIVAFLGATLVCITVLGSAGTERAKRQEMEKE